MMAAQLNEPVIILVDPQMGENIGMVARAMLNCSLTHLRIVRPRDGWPSEKAVEASAGAIAVIEKVELFDTTAEAVADLNFVYATTGRPRGQVTEVATPRKAAGDMQNMIGQGLRCGVLFGGERSGLVNDDVALANTVISVPLNPDFKSLNLAQAVLLVAYEWFTVTDQTDALFLDYGDSEAATLESFDNLMHRLELGLDQSGYFKSEDMRPTMRRNLRNIFQRGNLSEQEVRTLHGVFASLQRNKSQNRT